MKEQTNTQANVAEVALKTLDDFKNSLMIVSVVLNVAVLVTWMVVQVS